MKTIIIAFAVLLACSASAQEPRIGQTKSAALDSIFEYSPYARMLESKDSSKWIFVDGALLADVPGKYSLKLDRSRRVTTILFHSEAPEQSASFLLLCKHYQLEAGDPWVWIGDIDESYCLRQYHTTAEGIRVNQSNGEIDVIKLSRSQDDLDNKKLLAKSHKK